MLARLASYQDEQVQHVDLADLDVSVSNVRRSNTTADIDGLAASLQEFGLLQPIVVERTGSRYSVIIGQRRFWPPSDWDGLAFLPSSLTGRLMQSNGPSCH